MGKITLQYPVPKQPDFPVKATSINELMPNARRAVTKTLCRERLGVAKPGDKVLIVGPPYQDELALAAIIQAFKEKGIEADSVLEHEMANIPLGKLSVLSAEDGWNEIHWREETSNILGIEKPTLLEGRHFMADYLDRHPKYNTVFAGNAGESFWRISMGEKHASKHKGSFLTESSEHLLSRIYEFPDDVLLLVERKSVELLDKVSEVRITDPQGTDLFFSLTPQEARVWGPIHPTPGHLFMYPALSFMMLPIHPLLSSLKAKFAAEGISGHRVFCKAEGVIAGTSNHCGFFPHMKTYLKEGQVYKIEGGGKYGDLLREWMEKTKNVHYPGYPKPGSLYLFEIALATAPKYFRGRVDLFGAIRLFPNVYERNRSGVLHFGIGIEERDPEVIKYAKENKLPHEHVGHAAHTYFSTYEVKLRDTGEWVKIVDKGHLTALDDPEVRSLAAKYGDPDDILAEEWIPAIPGINYPGDYMRDYGQDPVPWVRKEIEGRLPATIGVAK